MRRDSISNTFLVAICLCVVCSIIVSTAAVLLQPIQEQNRVRYRRRNILIAAGLYDPDVPLEQSFARIQTRLVDLETGQFVDEHERIDPLTYDPQRAARDPALSVEVPGRLEEFPFERRERYVLVHLVEGDQGWEQIILPVYNRGLWSTLYAFLALDADLLTVRGITFYEQEETPGLGGEVENPNWQAQWVGKKVYDEDGNVALRVLRGEADPDAPHQIDGLAGATITARGVSGMIKFWLGEHGFGPFLERLAEEHADELAAEPPRVAWQTARARRP